MKNLKFVIIVAALLIGTNAHAQFKFGVKGGTNMSNFSGPDNTEARAGFNAGLTARFTVPIVGLFVLSGAELSSKGATIKAGGEEYSASPLYAQVPVHAGWTINLIAAKILMHAGPYWAYGLSGKVNGPDGKTDFFGEKGIAGKNDFGVGAGIGVDVWKLNFDLGYEWGLKDISNNSDKLKNRNMYVSVGYLF